MSASKLTSCAVQTEVTFNRNHQKDRVYDKIENAKRFKLIEMVSIYIRRFVSPLQDIELTHNRWKPRI